MTAAGESAAFKAQLLRQMFGFPSPEKNMCCYLAEPSLTLPLRTGYDPEHTYRPTGRRLCNAWQDDFQGSGPMLMLKCGAKVRRAWSRRDARAYKNGCRFHETPDTPSTLVQKARSELNNPKHMGYRVCFFF